MSLSSIVAIPSQPKEPIGQTDQTERLRSMATASERNRAVEDGSDSERGAMVGAVNALAPVSPTRRRVYVSLRGGHLRFVHLPLESAQDPEISEGATDGMFDVHASKPLDWSALCSALRGLDRG